MLSLGPQFSCAQTAAGLRPGLRGDYYEGLNFEHLVHTQRDAHLDFDWHEQSPVPGVPATSFTVRWTGWLVPPVTGRYILHLTVDDGVRLWLDQRLLLNEWRGQYLSVYQVAIDLQAGHAYPLRLDYCQYSATTRLLLSWERPRQSEAPASWHTLWGLTTELLSSRYREVVPARALVTNWSPAPRPLVGPRPGTRPPAKLVTNLRQRRARPAPTLPRPQPRTPSEPLLVKRTHVVQLISAPRANARDTLARQLASGVAVTWHALYFPQGQATLLPAVAASLDTLVGVLRQYPHLRLEVQGHTDNQGDALLNQHLSYQRAVAVCTYLTAHGIAASRLQPRGFGDTQPVADNREPAQRPRNRRVVLQPIP
ncbi:PA14 domain-containing protein [Hymenobacter polaris]|uniref:PA14 domain-containing protein n=1 Tax=Hymenobacter polaris TaxID=2682546 RepID=UPI00293BFAE6|nr:PA14 domain-containing protein [Hymenobacter polaris]